MHIDRGPESGPAIRGRRRPAWSARASLLLALLLALTLLGGTRQWATPAAAATGGAVVAWGTNDQGQTTVPDDLGDVVAIAAGAKYSLALRADGTVRAWGWDQYGATDVPPGLSQVIAIAAGSYHGLALKSNGTVVGWGWNQFGQTATSLTQVAAIAAGNDFSLALKRDGTLVGWGGNDYGQSAVPDAAKTDVAAIAAHGYHSLAVKRDGSVVVWGENALGGANIPTDLAGVTAVAAGSNHYLALKDNGQVVAWGSNLFGESSVPAAAQSGVIAVAAGTFHSLALKNDGTVVAWGYGQYGQSNVPAGLSNVSAIAEGQDHSLALVGESVAQPQAQTIIFDALANQTYGVAPFTVSATGGASGNPVTFTSMTPSVCTSSGANGATITIASTGTCTLTADQAGNDQWEAAPQVSQSFTVTPASLTISADDQTSTVGDALPALTWSASGWVNGEDEQVLSQAPTCTTSADATSPAGTYPITCTGAAAANYAIDYADGTLTIMAPPKQAQTISIDPVSDQAYGATPPTLNASATSNLPVSFASATETVCTVATDGHVTIVGVGTCTLTADQAGNETWNAAPQASTSFTVSPAVLTITADDHTMTAGDALPAFTWSASGWVNGEDEQALSQAPICATTATSSSPAGSYPITCTGAAAANYAIDYADGTLTIAAPAVLTPALSPATSQRTVGDSATLTVTVTSSRGTAVPDGTLITIAVSGVNTQTTTVATSNGQATFSYSATFPGTDTVTATVGGQSTQASVTWRTPASPLFASVFVLTPPRAFSIVTAGSLFGHPSGLVYYQGSGLTLKSQTITSVVAGRGTATIFGTATVDGQAVVFRVDVSGGLFSGTIRLRVSNGFDTGVLPASLTLTL